MINKDYCKSFTVPSIAILFYTLIPIDTLAEGFWDDAEGVVTARNYYFTRNFKGHERNQEKASAWAQSFILDFQSGYTRGTVGFGLDALGLTAFKLDAGKGAAPNGLLPSHNDGHPNKSFGRLALAAKMKVSETEFKIGEWRPVLPILRADDGRSLPQTFKGGQVTSNEFKNITLYTGQMHETSPMNSVSMDKMAYNSSKKIGKSNRFNFVGMEYSFNNKKSQVGIWADQLKDVYRQGLISFEHQEQIGDWHFNANTGYFFGKEDGSKRAGDLDNRTLFGLFSANYQHHTFYLGLQKLWGDSSWMRVTGTSGGTLANDSFANSYDNPRERSWQLRYDYDFAGVDLDGLTFMIRYIKGSNIYIKNTNNGKEWGRESELAYTFQQGYLKDLSIKWRFNALRKSWDKSAGRFNEHRIIINYPFSIL